MEVIQKETIDFSDLHKISCRANSESNLYNDGEVLYKIFKKIPYRHLRRKKEKIELLSNGIELNNVVLPKDIIVSGSLLSGYTMDYKKEAIILFEFVKRSKNINEFLKLVYNVSQTLREIHNDPRNIVVGDMSFSNVIFDKNFEHYFVDFDSCMIDGIPSDRISFLLSDYTVTRRIYNFDINKNTDRLSLILCMLHTIFAEEIDEISMYDYDYVSERVETLKNMREIVLEIKKNKKHIPEVPYVDELIKTQNKKRVKTI